MRELLSALDASAVSTGQSSEDGAVAHAEHEQRLVSGRLGMVAALYSALQCKHPASASHSLRVAIGCSTWAAALQMPDKLRTQLEAAALMHDVGKIGVPDAVLCKSGRLTPTEMQSIDRSREAARHILTTAGAPPAVIEGVIAASAWFDGSHRTVKLSGEETPAISRMIAIVDAYDAMTTDQVYRAARSKERAIATLYEQAGTQFDPDLVASYCDIFSQDQSALEEDVSRRWVTAIDDASAAPAWVPTITASPASATDGATPANSIESLFAAKLIGNMQDAVIYVDEQRRILQWNTGAERLTGVGATAAISKQFVPSLLDMSRSEGDLIKDEDCPLAEVITTGVQALDRVNVMGRNGQCLSVDMHLIPLGDSSTPQGAIVLLHDASSVATLEERCQTLHTEMTKDPMTQVANRAEFDRMLAAFIDAHQETGLPCSLIMVDIDHFKKINDTHGHQAGDEAIIAVASLLKSMCRAGDLVARYGGEEFTVLCADCNNATAAKRAEQIRRKLSETPHVNLGNKRLTASFGVTELQAGDTPETMLRRADRGLLQAKDQGRNQVVQLGDGMSSTDTTTSTGWFGFKGWGFAVLSGSKLIETRLVTNVPVELAVEKLRGFVADHDAKIIKTTENHLKLEVIDHPHASARRQNDRPVSFLIDLKLSQEHIEKTNNLGFAAGAYVYTYADVTIRPKRDRSNAQVTERARRLLGSLKSYLMAKEVDADAPGSSTYVPVTEGESSDA